MRHSVKLAWCAVGCALAIGLSIWGIVWGSETMNASQKDTESRKDFGDVTCVVLNVTVVDGDCCVVWVQHRLYTDAVTWLQWTYPDERNVTACNKTIPFDAGDRISCYADRAFIRVFLNKGSSYPLAIGLAPFTVSLFVLCFAYVGVILFPIAACNRYRFEEYMRPPPPIPNPVYHPNYDDEGYIDN